MTGNGGNICDDFVLQRGSRTTDLRQDDIRICRERSQTDFLDLMLEVQTMSVTVRPRRDMIALVEVSQLRIAQAHRQQTQLSQEPRRAHKMNCAVTRSDAWMLSGIRDPPPDIVVTAVKLVFWTY